MLYMVKNAYGRMGIAAVFTAAFALMISTFSSAKRIEVFAVIAMLVTTLTP